MCLCHELPSLPSLASMYRSISIVQLASSPLDH
ncbi:uncharacterized protein FFE2_03710 [Fusarium fujikuroi]|nr:uncharacterized protein FFE2_03710 [Fusarium fujikuroi]SCN95344.1 uncharacterized protein FFC1_07292 [Fusarium fujikuroi]SCV30868.1 uncharacterized protein FFFS_02534 [Fusarium fujikuroi]